MTHASLRLLLTICLSALSIWSADLRGANLSGKVQYNGLPVPGASVTATQGDTKIAALTDAQGAYAFEGLADGTWKLDVEISGFAPQSAEAAILAGAAATKDWELVMLPIADLKAQLVKPRAPGAAAPARTELVATAKPEDAKKKAAPAANGQQQQQQQAPENSADSDLNRRAADGLLVNGSVNNGAASPFAQMPAFGNNRRGGRSLYTGNLGVSMDHSLFDAAPYSLTGQSTPKPDFYRMQGLASFGGPLRIPRLLRNGPMIFVNYQWTRNRTASTQSVLVPTAAQRSGDLGNGNIIPASRISAQALSLLQYFPLPNFTGSSRYNYQAPLVNNLHQDSLQARADKPIGRKNGINGTFAFQSMRSDSPNIFGFLDSGRMLGINSQVTWRHTFGSRFFSSFSYQFSRQSFTTLPYFSNLFNVSGAAGIGGNLQDALNWGPPSLQFSSGLAGLSDARYSATHNQTGALSFSTFWLKGKHNITFGSDYRRQQFNTLAQQDPRGTFTFTGQTTGGNDFASFLLGTPDASSIAYGNADKYFRANILDGFFNDDFRLRPGFTLNWGARWDYNSPISELYGRLVNLAVGPNFSTATPAIGDRLMNPDKRNISPRVSVAWRPFAASSMVIRAGYGIYYDTSVYQSIANLMAQQAPLSTSLRIAASAAAPLTLANGFPRSSAVGTGTTFGVDPNFKLGYAQNWQVALQRDLPFALQMVATYLGIKGSNAIQQFLPNTYPTGAVNPCPACPSGFSYMTSNGQSTRESGQIQLRRRLRSGFASELSYTYAKAIDDASLGARGTYLTAQDWLNLPGERGRSNFDQRHLLTWQVQYTTGMGLRGGGALMGGWRGALLKEWTVTSNINAGSGLPLTPIYLSPVAGTGSTGSLRPDYTGAPIYSAPSGLNLNPAAFALPASGRWGNAGRNIITGPGQFGLAASMTRTFRLNDRFSSDLRIDMQNALNHPTFPSWNTVVTSSQFGLPSTANSMRTVQTTFRVRF